MSDNPARDVLVEAMYAVTSDRPNTHGDAIVNHEAIAALWSAYLTKRFGVSIDLTAMDVALLQALLKIARTITGDPTHADHYVDQAGYAAIAALCAGVKVPNQ